MRTFPLIGLIGYSLALVSGNQLLPLTIGFLVVAAFLLLSYWHKLSQSNAAGVTTEMSGLATFLVGALICYGHFWIATTISVASLLLLDLKAGLEKLAAKAPPREILTFAKFLLLTGVILPVLPRQEYTRFHINPFQDVAGGGGDQRDFVRQLSAAEGDESEGRSGAGGAAGRRVFVDRDDGRDGEAGAAGERTTPVFGGILVASGVMYLRLAVLLALFNRSLMSLLDLTFVVLAVVAIAAGWLWSRRADASAQEIKREFEPSNPLELGAAFLFAGLFLAMLVATQLAVTYLGRAGVNTLAAVMGVTDVDPFIMGMTQAAGTVTAVKVAAAAVLIAASSNNVVKGIYAYSLADRKTGVQSLVLLVGLAAAGLVPLFWIGW